jgi:hypothetical protein
MQASEAEQNDARPSSQDRKISFPDTPPAAPDRSKSAELTREDTASEPHPTTRTSSRSKGWPDAAAPSAGGQLFVFMEAETAWKSFEPPSPSEAGRYSLRIRIEGDRVVEVWPVANPPATTRQVRASQLVLGLEIEGVPDGEYAAEVVIESREPPAR